MYTKLQFSRDLDQELKKEFNVVRLSRWAYGKYLDMGTNFENGLDEVVMKIVAMEEGPEFEYTKEELEQIVNELKK